MDTQKGLTREARNDQVSTEKGCCSEAKLKDKGWLFGLGLGTMLTTWSYFQKVDVLAPSSHRWASPPSTAPEKAAAFSRKDLKPQYCTWQIFAQLTIAWTNARENASYLFKFFCQRSVKNSDISNKKLLYRDNSSSLLVLVLLPRIPPESLGRCLKSVSTASSSSPGERYCDGGGEY